jgi:DNA invertase Pin-like site-specific DNA recombinase
VQEEGMAIPAAQYLRMSTEDQVFHDKPESPHQGIRRQEWLRHRKNIRRPWKKAILVYDVSRWGRFQNPDEAAHYEFLCAESGIPLHYCAKQFSNDGTASSAIVKALKRSMAAEFSRELGEKVVRGKTLLAKVGFWMGGPPGYGYRRRLVSADGKLKRVLKRG